MAQDWRFECVSARATILVAQQAIERNTVGPVLQSQVRRAAELIDVIFLMGNTSVFDDPHASSVDSFMQKMLKATGGRATDRAMAASGIAKKIASGDRVSEEEEKELSSFLKLLLRTLADHASSRE